VQGVVVSARNETELLRAEEALREKEEQLLHAQKMEAIGRLAGGVAHDFNNLLTVILGYCEVLLRQKTAGHPDREFLEEIQAASERASNLTRQLLTFSHKQVTRPRVLDLDAVIVELTRLLRRLIGEDIALETRLHARGRVTGDRGQLEQVLLNLAVNARDAMHDGGRLTIETADVVVEGDRPGKRAGPHVLVTVSDTGCGMDAPTRARAFDPFFTTKPLGKGTGLGLSTVYGIVTQCGGAIEVQSEPGAGATFRIYLPAAAATAGEASPALVVAPPGGTETILLVEDDASVRRLVERVLTASGYHVLVAADPVEALALSRERDGAIDLLLTDLVMPNMGGRALSDALRSERPGLKVLLMSGYADDDAARARPDDAFIQKPLRSEQLLERLREVLGAPGVSR
jgi:nitrogen-specific signal transduction histidine kinase